MLFKALYTANDVCSTAKVDSVISIPNLLGDAVLFIFIAFQILPLL